MARSMPVNEEDERWKMKLAALKKILDKGADKATFIERRQMNALQPQEEERPLEQLRVPRGGQEGVG